MPNPTLLITRLLDGEIPARGKCSACDAELDLADAIEPTEHRGKRLQAMFEKHVKEKHPEERKRSLTHW